ncbi:unnamed protein product [Caenorhabditis brenneri]
MSLSRPDRFPLLKLPWLCIECVLQNSDLFDIIFFALTSKRTRQIVKYLRIPLNRIGISVRDTTDIWLCGFSKIWNFSKPNLELSSYQNSKRTPLMLRNNPIPLYISRTDDDITSYTDGNTIDALKLAIQFLNEMFKCSIERVYIDADNFTESGDIGVRSTRNLYITNEKTRSLGYAHNQNMSLLLKNLEVTDICSFFGTNTELDFYCDPKLFKCKELQFLGTAAWVTLEILLQFEVPRLTFIKCLFSVEDILSFVTQWFHSDNMKLEYLYLPYQRQKFSSETFQTAELNPVPFCGRTRVPLSGPFRYIDFSKGLELVRRDGLQATIHAGEERFVFYIWHNQ